MGQELSNGGATLWHLRFSIDELALSAMPSEAIHVRVAENSEKPRTEIRAGLEPGEGVKRPEHRIVDEVLRVRSVPAQKVPGKPSYGLEVRKDRGLEVGPDELPSAPVTGHRLSSRPREDQRWPRSPTHLLAER